MDTIDRAVVVGGSIAGLAAAATLARRVGEVLVVERRPPDEGGSTAPQGGLPHVMLAAGQRVLEELFPGFAAQLIGRGAHDGGGDPCRLPCYWVAGGRTRRHLRLPDLGFPRAMCSRGLLESQLRAAVLALPNVRVLDTSVVGLEVTAVGTDAAAVTGVRVRENQHPVAADLVIDASGRGSRVTDWLTAANFPVPACSEVVVDLRYTSFVVERRAEDFEGAAFAVVQNTAAVPRIGVALPMEGDRWQVVLGGYFGAAAPTTPAGAQAYARALIDPSIGDLLDRPHLAEPARYTFRSSLRHHWERLSPHPRGLCAVGDAVASFNPLYGQGMTSALLQAEALGVAVDRFGGGPRLAPATARATARVVDNPWTTATGADFVYAATGGRRPRSASIINRHVERVTRAAAVDETVNAGFTAVQQMLAAPPTLFRPAIVLRSLRYGAR